MNKMIKYLIMDVDGTLTDGKIYMGSDGEICKAFNVKDGYGINDIAISEGIIPVIITGRESKILLNRCQELGVVEIHQGIENKVEKMKEIVDDFSSVAYIGDDMNDIESMYLVKEHGGLIACPADAAKQVIAIADFVSTKNGGDGAVREFIEWLLNIV